MKSVGVFEYGSHQKTSFHLHGQTDSYSLGCDCDDCDFGCACSCLADKAVDNYPWTFGIVVGIVVGIIVCSCIGIKWYYDNKETLEDAEKAEVPTKQIEN